MINKNIDFALIGHNYLTFLLSIGPLNRGKKVLLLDDDRFNYGDFFTNSLTQIDLNFIKSLGHKTSSMPLINIEKYLTFEEKIFFMGKKQILLGRSPGKNLMELCRKFPEFFGPTLVFRFDEEFIDKFDKDFIKGCEDVANHLINPVGNTKLLQLFYQFFSPEFKAIFDQFINSISNKDKETEKFKSDLATLVYLSRGFFQSHFSTTGTKVELGHVLICLLSPYYRLNHPLLTHDLLNIFKVKGGEFKKLNLGDLKFQRGAIKGMELESYEGLITPKKIFFVGGHPLGLPIKFERPKNIYNCLRAEINIKKIPKYLIGKKIVFSSPLKVSTNRPMFEADFFENKIELNIVVQKKNGSKVEFIKDAILEELKQDLKYLFFDAKIDIISCEMKFTHDIFIEENNKNNNIKGEFKFKNKLSDLLFTLDPIKLHRPKNVFYLGPYNDGFLGTLSSLIEIYRWQERI